MSEELGFMSKRTFSGVLNPLIDLLQTKSSFGTAIVFIPVDMKNFLVGAGQSSLLTAKSVRDGLRCREFSSQGK